MKRYLHFVIVGAAALIVLAGPLLCQTMQPSRLAISGDEAAAAKRPAESVHIRGNSGAAVTLEEFGDFECPTCKNFAAFLDEVIKEYHPRLRLIFRNYPLAMHHYARDAARAAEAAGLQGHYWEMHDMLFREQPVWSSSTNARTLFISYAETLGLNLARFQQDMEKIAPSIYVNKREMGTNDRTEDGVRRLIDEAVKATSSVSEKK